MKIVIDTNILLSALIKNSITREIILKTNWKYFYPENSLEEMEKAKEIMLTIDPKDILFIAVALNIENSIIWSDDKHFQKQEKIKTLTSPQIVKLYKSTGHPCA
jgi:predicted nucleic acid-binding protein